MARREEERESRAQQLVRNLVSRINQVSKLSELELTDDLVSEKGELSQLAEEFANAKEERDKLKPTQLRRVFHDLKRLEQKARRRQQAFTEVRTALALTLPELAYAYGREVIPRPFYDLVKALLQRVQDVNDLQRLVALLSVLLAYHKYHEKVRKTSQQADQQTQGG